MNIQALVRGYSNGWAGLGLETLKALPKTFAIWRCCDLVLM